MQKGKLFLGTSGYQYKEWKGKFYPEKLPQKEWLSYYASQFPTVEINGSFYGSLSDKTYKKWYAATPENFTFVLKGHRYITHLKKLKDVEEAVEQFFFAASHLQEKLSVIVWQFSAKFNATETNKKRFATFLPLLPTEIKHAFEFRHVSWFEETTLFEKYSNMCLVINDTPAFSVIDTAIGNFVYIRFHGPDKLYASKYSDDELQIWAKRIVEFLKMYNVYCYFNNDLSGYAIQNTHTLKDFIEKQFV